jgi:predicted secreted protein
LRVRFTGSFGSTGYSWNLSTKPKGSVLKKTNDYTAGGGCPGGAVGCPSTVVFVFKAEGRGSTHFTFHLLPPGRGAKPQGTFTQSVTVR